MCLSFGLSVLYSPKEELRTSACEFWCAILSSKDEVILILFCFLEANLIVIYIGEVQRVIFYWHSLSLSTLTFDLVDLQPVLIDWLPSYFELKGALEIYGFQSKSSFNRDSLHAGKLFLLFTSLLSTMQMIEIYIMNVIDLFRVKYKNPLNYQFWQSVAKQPKSATLSQTIGINTLQKFEKIKNLKI